MGRKPCLDCGTLTTKTRCLGCTRAQSRARDARRGNRHARGLTSEYDRNRAILLANATVCAVCGLPGTRDDPLTAGHIIARANGGTNDLANLRAEHASYNYGQGRRTCRAAASRER